VQFARKIVRNSMVANTVLPVFFRLTDACVVRRRSINTMKEVNPQVGKQLKVISQLWIFIKLI